MGYLTNYSLEAHTDESNRKAVWEDICTLYEGLFKEGMLASTVTDEIPWSKIYVQGSDAVKWYNHDIDMTKLSEKYPTVTFVLDGVGEEQGDVWKKIFLGGKMKYLEPEIVWPDEDSVEWV